MTTAAAQAPVAAPEPNGKAQERHITWEQFKRRYLQREDKYKYEWVNGTVEKTLRTMDQHQQLILVKLLEWLDSLRTPSHKLGRLLAEVDTFFAGNHRRPDISYFSEAQLAAIPKGNQEPQFVIEILSTSDQILKVHKKMQDYRRANIPVIWHIFPELEEVHVYTGENMTICRGEKLCSAAPVLPEFAIPAKEIFKFGQ